MGEWVILGNDFACLLLLKFMCLSFFFVSRRVCVRAEGVVGEEKGSWVKGTGPPFLLKRWTTRIAQDLHP